MTPILKPDEIDALLALFKQKNGEVDTYEVGEKTERLPDNDDESSGEAKQM